MNYDYDPEVDVLTIKVKEGKPDYGEQAGNVILHYNKNNQLIEVEILYASELLKVSKPAPTKASV